MDHTSEVLGRLSQRLDEAADDAERALLLGEVVGVFEAVQSTVQPEIRNPPLALARIELGEVEAALAKCEQVSQAPSVHLHSPGRRRTSQAVKLAGRVVQDQKIVGYGHASPHHSGGGGRAATAAVTASAVSSRSTSWAGSPAAVATSPSAVNRVIWSAA